MPKPSLNRKSVSLDVMGRAVDAVIQNPSDGAWSIVSIDVEGWPRLPPYREECFKSEEETIAKVRELVGAVLK